MKQLQKAMPTIARKKEHKLPILLGSWFVWVYQGCAMHYGKQSIGQPYVQNKTETIMPSAPGLSPSNSLPELQESVTKKEAKQAAKKKLAETEKAINQCFHYAKQIQEKNYKEQWGETLSHTKWVSGIGNSLLQSNTKAKAGRASLLDATLANASQCLHETTQYILQAEQLKSQKAYKRLRKKQIKLKGQLCFIRNEMSQYLLIFNDKQSKYIE